MRNLKWGFLVAGLVALPVVASAQGGSVTTSPLAQAAPVLGLPALLAAALILALVGARFLRLAPRGLAGLALAAATTVFVGVGYAVVPSQVVVDGDECRMETTHPYSPNTYMVVLRSECPNPIEIDAIAPNCNDCSGEDIGGPASVCTEVPPTIQNGLSTCQPGQILPPGGECYLPTCGPI
jgi:hypothetical protein